MLGLFVTGYFLTVAACGAPDRVMKPRPPTLKLDPNDPDAGRDAMLAVTNSIANWMFVAAAVTFLLGFLLHNCSDFTPLISLPSW